VARLLALHFLVKRSSLCPTGMLPQSPTVPGDGWARRQELAWKASGRAKRRELEGQHPLEAQVVEGELGDAAPALARGEDQEQPQGVAVAADGFSFGAGASSDTWQVRERRVAYPDLTMSRHQCAVCALAHPREECLVRGVRWETDTSSRRVYVRPRGLL
jgi:hypothetical protein